MCTVLEWRSGLGMPDAPHPSRHIREDLRQLLTLRRWNATICISAIFMTDHAKDVVSESGDTSADHAGDASVATGSKRPRGRTGCLNCRRRRKKCDERKPSCAKCRRLGDDCEWDTRGVTFRLSGIDSTHPSMQAQAKKQSSVVQAFQMVDVTFDSSTHRRIENRESGSQGPIASPIDDVVNPDVDMQDIKRTVPNDTDQTDRAGDAETYEETIRAISKSLSPVYTRHRSSFSGADDVNEPISGQNSQPGVPRQREHSNHEIYADRLISPRASMSSAHISSNGHAPDIYGFTAAQLGTLDYLTETQGMLPDEPLSWSAYERDTDISPGYNPFLVESPDTFSMYYPNAEYRNLHATLYNHMVETARGTGLTRQGTPETGIIDNSPQNARNPSSLALHDHDNRPPPKGITAQREMVLWQNWLDEIVVWLDMFDHDCHFRNTFPQLARSSRALELSILALSSRQLERMDPDKPYTESLGLYQEAIQSIVENLQFMDTAVIGACVLLCVLEMMSSSPRDWAKHLDGCAMLIKAAGINGVSGGVRQAIFWCFARMDMWGGFLTDTNTKIPTGLWFLPSGSMSAAVSRFKADFTSFDQYANYAVFLCASVLNVVSNDDKQSYSTRWKTLFDLLEDWYSNRPAGMKPLICRQEGAEWYPFPMILYANDPAISGNQLYHAAALLLLQAKPKDIKIRSHKSLFWHARQICGITASNSSQ